MELPPQCDDGGALRFHFSVALARHFHFRFRSPFRISSVEGRLLLSLSIAEFHAEKKDLF